MTYQVRPVYPASAPSAAGPPAAVPRYRLHIRFPGVCDPVRAGLEGVGVVRFALSNATGRLVERVDAEPVRLVVPVTGREEVDDVVMQVLYQRGALGRTEVLFETEEGVQVLHPGPAAGEGRRR